MDDKCSIKPYGLTDTLYVRFKRDFDFNDEFMWGGYANPDEMLFVFTPTYSAPSETYQVRAYKNFLSEETLDPFVKGSVVRIFNILEAVDVSNIKTDFYL